MRTFFLTMLTCVIANFQLPTQAATVYQPMSDCCCCETLFSLNCTLGYGRINAPHEALVGSSLLDPILTQVLNTHNSTGGFSFRVFGNGLLRLNSFAFIGAELGFSYYPHTKQSQLFSLDVDSGPIRIGRSILTRGYGVDLLLDLAFQPCAAFLLSLKPGVQFAYQSNHATLNIDITPAPFFFDTDARYRNTAFLPEIIIALDGKTWFNKFCSCNCISTIGITYQHVFGHNDTFVDKRVASRDMVGLNIGFIF